MAIAMAICLQGPQILVGVAGGKASGKGGSEGPSGLSMVATFDEELSMIMAQFEVPKGLQDKFIA